ncbi:auxin-responsive protein SAUR76 [Prosopis cineraria]|uniref:auxin-responsive protein SAUR76 n=1 Tax=Prosopis cineraria TaxID=364024 RepID=UPI0024102C84|nr:auxin-responsive protein SAUR76 [Prosopis cineraria]
MKKINLILRKCRSLSTKIARSSSYSSLRSKSAKEDTWGRKSEVGGGGGEGQECETIYVGSTRKRYVISSKYLNHPLMNALMDKSKSTEEGSHGRGIMVVNCEVVLFDHLLWMLEHADPKLIGSESLEELAELYVF